MVKRLKRPRDSISLAKMIGDIATGQLEDTAPSEGKNQAAVSLGRLGGAKGGRSRALSLTGEERAEAARLAAQARWKKRDR